MNETFDVEMPDGTIIEGVPVGTSKSEIMAKWQRANQPRSGVREVGRQFALGTRAVIEGVAGYNPFSIAADALGGVMNTVAGVTEPGASPYASYPVRDVVSNALTRIGFPQPETEAEQRMGRVNQLGGAALGTAGMARAIPAVFNPTADSALAGFSQVFGANPVQQVVAGTVSPAAGEGLRAAGVREPWPTAAEVITGLMVPSDKAISRAAESKRVGDLVRGTGASAATRTAPARAVGGTKDLLTTEGRGNVVGRILRDASNDPRQAVDSLGDVPQFVKGSRPTIGQASGDVGLLRLEGIAEQTIDVPDVVSNPGRMAAGRMAANRARARAIEALRPVDEGFERLRKGINARFKPRLDFVMKNRQPVPTAPVIAKIDEVLATPGIGQRAELADTLTYTRNRLEALGDVTDPLDLQAVRQDISELVEGKLKGAATRDGRAVGGGVKGLSRKVMRDDVIAAMDDAIEAGAPGYKDKWLKPYAAARQSLDRRKIVGDIANKGRTTQIDTEGLPILSSAGFDRAMRANATKFARLTPAQRATLQNVRADLQRGARGNSAVVQGTGSSTAKNIVGGASVASIIGRTLGTGPRREPFPLGDKFRFLFGYTDRQINDLLIEAMLDPALGRKLLAKANEEAVEDAAKALEDMATKRALATSQINVQTKD